MRDGRGFLSRGRDAEEDTPQWCGTLTSLPPTTHPVVHACLVALAYLGAYELRFEFAIRRSSCIALYDPPVLVVLRPAFFYLFGLFTTTGAT
jgi:hypothetical protein